MSERDWALPLGNGRAVVLTLPSDGLSPEEDQLVFKWLRIIRPGLAAPTQTPDGF